MRSWCVKWESCEKDRKIHKTWLPNVSVTSTLSQGRDESSIHALHANVTASLPILCLEAESGNSFTSRATTDASLLW